MYIPEFWCGVVATILFEILLSLVMAVIDALKGGDDDETTKKAD